MKRILISEKNLRKLVRAELLRELDEEELVDDGPVVQPEIGSDEEEWKNFTRRASREIERIVRGIESQAGEDYNVDKRHLAKMLWSLTMGTMGNMDLEDILDQQGNVEALYSYLAWIEDAAEELNSIEEWQEWFDEVTGPEGIGFRGLKGEELEYERDSIPFFRAEDVVEKLAGRGGIPSLVGDELFDDDWTSRVPNNFWDDVGDTLSRRAHALLRELVVDLGGDKLGWMKYLKNPDRRPKIEDRLEMATEWVKEPPMRQGKSFLDFARWYQKIASVGGHFGPKEVVAAIETMRSPRRSDSSDDILAGLEASAEG